MTFLVERLAELRRHLQHLRDLRPQVTSSAAIEASLTLHNDVLFSLLRGYEYGHGPYRLEP